ncbi:MAG: DedA family protein, partial [Muribaculaceae bacterium]|nr:DedA family protein [Muribaculaceae bacterium]
GISKMNVGVFAIFTFLGALVWNSVLGGLGYWLANTVSPDDLFVKVEEYNQYLTWFGYGIALVCVIFILWNAFKPKKG